MTRRLVLAVAWSLMSPAAAAAQEAVTMTVPSTAGFTVTNVTETTDAEPVRVSFETLVVVPGNQLRVSVMADSATFTRPVSSGLSIPATKVSWTTAGASGGTGSSGSLNASSYTTMFVSSEGSVSGGFDVTWKLGAPGGGIRAGSHTLVVRYRLEAQ